MLLGMKSERSRGRRKEVDAERHKEIGAKIQEARVLAGLSQEGLGNLMRPTVTDGTISNYERGVSAVDVPTLEELGRVLKQPVHFFIGLAAPERDSDAEAIGRAVLRVVEDRGMLKERRGRRVPDNMRTFPVINRVPASDASVRDSQLHDTIDIPEYFWSGAEDPKVYFVSGDCMANSGIVNGDHAIIDAAKTNPRDGQTVIAQLNGALTLKRFMRAGGRIELHPNAPGYDPITIGPEDELVIVGCLHKVFPTGER